MGRKVHPIGFRLKINRPWEARWFAEGERYREMLHEDFRIRDFIFKETERAGISKIEIERYPSQVVVTIFTAKPGIVIGRKGEAVKKIRTGLEELTSKKVKVEVEEIEKPDLDAKLVAENNYELNRQDLYVKSISADEGLKVKRMKAGARGRYKPRIKRSSHLTVVLDEREE